MTAGDEQDKALDGYMIQWNRFRRESGHVLAAHELLALGELLREVDAQNAARERQPVAEWRSWCRTRGKLEKLLGMHPGSLDTSRRVCVRWQPTAASWTTTEETDHDAHPQDQ